MLDTTLPPPPGAHRLPTTPATPNQIAASDHAARNWHAPTPAPLRPGTPAHAQAIAAMFADTFNPYKPSVIAWPQLDPAARDRLVTLPIWNIAVQTEGKARLRILTFAHTLTNPHWREPIELNGWEEGRHKAVLSSLVQAYGITLAPEPPYLAPRNPEWAYLVTGFSECIDSFFAFGLFAMAQRSGLFPPALVDTFEPVIQEECRHILLFANWIAARRANTPLWARPWFELRVAAVWLFLAYERMGIARGLGADTNSRAAGPEANFTVTTGSSLSTDPPSLPALLDLCLAENTRRFAGYDPRLERPTTMPTLVRLARRLMPPKAA